VLYSGVWRERVTTLAIISASQVVTIDHTSGHGLKPLWALTGGNLYQLTDNCYDVRHAGVRGHLLLVAACVGPRGSSSTVGQLMCS
jgi:hypothetical protein